MIDVLNPGLLTTIQDGGRKGYERYGFPQSGFFDPFLASVANRLVGNRIDAPLLEFALIGPTLRFLKPVSVAVTGFNVDYECDGAVSCNSAFAVKEGSVLRFTAMKGWFGYIAVSGGILAQKMLGSASTYFAGGLGIRLQRDSTLQIAESDPQIWRIRDGVLKLPKDSELQILLAQHSSDFNAGEIQNFTKQEYKIHSQSNRMGIRLEGEPIETPLIRRSVPTLPGVVQVPGGGLPIILGPEGPTTGGYPQIGMLSRTSWTVLAGAQPGSRIRFRWLDAEAARREWDARQNIFRDADAWQK
jgi:antagonist of KipI